MIFRILLLSSLLCFARNASGQGCSDAGLCTMNSFKPETVTKSPAGNNRIKVGSSYGGADNQITVLGPYIEYNRRISSNLSFDIRLTSLSQSGNNISSFGLSDLYANINYTIASKTNVTAGVKFPLSDGNTKKDNLPLPMDYQSSLGTTDLLLGVSHQIGKFIIVAAFQQALNQNKNEFVSGDYPSGSKIREFQTTNGYKRKGDLMMRVAYPFKLTEKLSLTPSLLPIYHLGNDTYTDAGVEKEIEGSKGLTLNANLFFDFTINEKSAFQFSLGSPLAVRKSRPDGLTRSFVAALEYQFKF